MDATHNMSAGDIKLSWKPPSNVSARNKIEFYRVKFRKEGPLHHLQYLVPHVNYTDVPGVRKCWRCTFTWLRIGLRGSCLMILIPKKMQIVFLHLFFRIKPGLLSNNYTGSMTIVFQSPLYQLVVKARTTTVHRHLN